MIPGVSRNLSESFEEPSRGQWQVFAQLCFVREAVFDRGHDEWFNIIPPSELQQPSANSSRVPNSCMRDEEKGKLSAAYEVGDQSRMRTAISLDEVAIYHDWALGSRLSPLALCVSICSPVL
jgi:hypothetical protein